MRKRRERERAFLEGTNPSAQAQRERAHLEGTNPSAQAQRKHFWKEQILVRKRRESISGRNNS